MALKIEHFIIDENMKADYLKLYKETLKPIVNSLDSTRPFLLSSPSNGIKTEEYVT